MTSEQLQQFVLNQLEDMKAQDIKLLDVRQLTSMTDAMVIASGTSTRHVRAIADNLVTAAKQEGLDILGIEGEFGSEWVLVDLTDVVVHLMLPDTRDFYQIEKLWSPASVKSASA